MAGYPPLTEFQIKEKLDNKCNVIPYSKIKNYKTIEQMLGPYKRCVILFENQPNYGHWACAFFDRLGRLNFFNSYGNYSEDGKKNSGFPDAYLPFIDKRYRKAFSEDLPYLSNLFLKSKYELEYNDKQYQKMNKDIKTCGYWCVMRLKFEDMTDEEFYNFIQTNCKYHGLSPDELVAQFA